MVWRLIATRRGNRTSRPGCRPSHPAPQSLRWRLIQGGPLMAGIRVFLRCVGEALCANAVKALAGLVPMGGVLYDVAADAYQRLRECQMEEQLRSVVEDVATADPAEVKAAAKDVAALVAADQP